MEALVFAQETSHQAKRCQRGIKPEVPFGYEALLTEDQRHRVDRCREFGWELHFIRRPTFGEPTVVMLDADERNSWRICDDGALEAFKDSRAA